MYKNIPNINFLSREQINQTPIQENGESLIDIPITERIFHREGEGKKWLVAKIRKTVVHMLINASESFPEGYKFVVMSAYIPISLQKQVWDRKYEKIKLQNPNITDQMKLEKLTRKYAAYPIKGAPHNTGGAVDIIILDEINQELDMGSPFGGVGDPAHTRYDQITEKQKQNRQLL